MLDDLDLGPDSTPERHGIHVCQSCGCGTLQFTLLSWSVWAQCRCGYGWEIPSSNVSRRVN